MLLLPSCSPENETLCQLCEGVRCECEDVSVRVECEDVSVRVENVRV